MPEIKQSERMELARAEALEMLQMPEAKRQIGVAEYVLETANGPVKVKLTAVKDLEFDPAEAEASYLFEKQEAEGKAVKRKAEADAKKAVDLAKKARAKADKEAKA